MRSLSRTLIVTLGVGLLACAAMPASAQTASWPQRSVRFIVTLGPGSGADIGGRVLADRLTKKWNQPVVIENRPGGDGIVAINAFVSAKDDHILLLSPTSVFTAHPFLHDNLPYKPSDLAPIARISNTLIGVTVPVGLPVSNMKELAALAQSKPGELNWAGVTGALEFNFGGWLKSNNMTMTKVPYRNAVEAANDLAENRVQVYSSAIAISQPQLQLGKIKLLAVVNSVRAPIYPNVPTVAEAGFPDMTLDGLVGLFGPPAMPLEQRRRIAADIKEVMDADPIIKERLTATGQVFNPGGPDEFNKAIEEQRTALARNAEAMGMKAKQ
jgi:tripartite-type tricarboxylate transporter receptor subunit TctC